MLLDRRLSATIPPLELGTVRALFDALQLAPPRLVVRIVGANGKGSTAAGISRGLEAAGVSSVTFMSPAVRCPSEQAWINGVAVSPQAWAAMSARVWPLAELQGASRFEAELATTLALGDEAGAEVAILEAGFGGPADAVAVWPDHLRVFCSVEVEHAAVLGASLREVVATELSDVVPEGLVIAGPAQADRLRPECRRRGLRLAIAPREAVLPEEPPWAAENRGRARAAVAWCLTSLGARPEVMAPVDEALARPVALDGRWEWPCADLLCDGAHTPEAARLLRSALSGRSVDWIFACMGDKDLAGMMGELLRPGDRLLALSLPHPRATSPHLVLAEARMHQGVEVRQVSDMAEARGLADGRLQVATGSFAVVGASDGCQKHTKGEVSCV